MNNKMTTFKPFLLLISLLALALTSSSTPLRDLSKGNYIPCAYRLAIKTTPVLNAGTTSNVSITVGDMGEIAPTPGVLFLDVQTGNPGTTSNVSITLADKCGNNLTIPNLVDWDDNVENAGHVYFQTGQLDKLIGAMVNRSTFASKPCFINVTITGTGSRPKWYLGTITVRSTEIETFTFYFREEINSYINYNAYRNDCPPCHKGFLAI